MLCTRGFESHPRRQFFPPPPPPPFFFSLPTRYFQLFHGSIFLLLTNLFRFSLLKIFFKSFLQAIDSRKCHQPLEILSFFLPSFHPPPQTQFLSLFHGPFFFFQIYFSIILKSFFQSFLSISPVLFLLFIPLPPQIFFIPHPQTSSTSSPFFI